MTTRIATIADLHYSQSSLEHIPWRKGERANEFLLNVVERLNNSIKPDITVILGDLLNEPNDIHAKQLLKTLKNSIDLLDSQVIILRGNHDPAQQIFSSIMGTPVDFLDIKGVRFIPFVDKDEPECNAFRSSFDFERMRNLSASFSGQMVFLQHVPLFPPDLAHGHYNYTNVDELLAGISALSNPTLTIAGHEHAGMEMVRSGKDRFLAAPALCENPFQFMIIEIDGDEIKCERKQLQLTS